MKKFLIIQTAFIGDVVLATALIEKLSSFFPKASIDVLVRKGNEGLLKNNPHIHQVLIWNKKEKKIINLLKVLIFIRRNKYDTVINLQRFFATGLLTAFSNAKQRIGFDKNPLSFLFSQRIKHRIEQGIHEVERNNDLIKSFTNNSRNKPKLYPSAEDIKEVSKYKTVEFITITPSSVWFTKQYPKDKWIEFINQVPENLQIYLLGGPDNIDDCNLILNESIHKKITNLAGKLGFLQSAALMKDARMNFTNDSAPLHFATAVNAPVTAIFCSTIPGFGFTPLSDISIIVETIEPLSCRPCGLHGYNKCPLGHFKCATTIQTIQLLNTISDESRF